MDPLQCFVIFTRFLYLGEVYEIISSMKEKIKMAIEIPKDKSELYGKINVILHKMWHKLNSPLDMANNVFNSK
jgi:hypothetical protein